MILKVMQTLDGEGICLTDEAGELLPMQASCSLLTFAGREVSRLRVDFHVAELGSGGVRLELSSKARISKDAK